MREACNNKKRCQNTELFDDESKLTSEIIHDKKRRKDDVTYDESNGIHEECSDTCSCTTTVALNGDQYEAFNQTVLGLAGKIEECAEIFKMMKKQHNCSLEVEGRIGVLKDPETNERIRLPVESYVLLEPSSNQFSSTFDSALSENNYTTLSSALHTCLNVQTDFDGKPFETSKVLGKDLIIFTNTYDHFVNMNEDVFKTLNIQRNSDANAPFPSRARVTYPISKDSFSAGCKKPLEIIWKDKLFVFDFYTGQNKQELSGNSEELHCLDIRIAINIEYQLPNILDISRPIMTRQRQRCSYPLNGKFRIDSTQVRTTQEIKFPRNNGRSNRVTERKLYELEVEINPTLLINEITKKKNGKAHQLYPLIQDFLGVLRDLAMYVTCTTTSSTCGTNPSNTHINVTTERKPSELENSRGSLNFTTKIKPLINLRVNAQPDEILKQYEQTIGSTYPLIGDYLYRAIAPSLKNVITS